MLVALWFTFLFNYNQMHYAGKYLHYFFCVVAQIWFKGSDQNWQLATLYLNQCHIFAQILPLILFRSGETLRDNALKAINNGRMREATALTRFLPGAAPGVWSSADRDEDPPLFNKLDFNLQIAGLNEKPKSDAYFMAKWQRHSRSDKLVLPNQDWYDRIYPAGAPVIDFLAVAKENPDGWAYPSPTLLDHWRSNRGIGDTYPANVKVKEIVIGQASDKDVQSFTVWTAKQYAYDQLGFPGSALSFDTEMTAISTYDWIRLNRVGMEELVLAKKLGKKDDSETDLVGVTDKWMNLPSKMFVGDGFSWAAVVSLPIKRKDKDKVFSLKDRQGLEGVAKFFNALPTLTGLNVDEDCRITERIVSFLTFRDVTLNSVDIDVLATVAGYDGPTNMTALSLLILGGAMNKSVSCGDFSWDKPYDQLPVSLQAYMLSDIRFGHICYNVLMSVLLLEIFPDVETACRYTATTQDRFIEWFSKQLIGKSIAKVEVYAPDKAAATTREELILSLRYRDTRSKLSGCPDRIRELSFLLHGRTPTLCFGGPRWLHLAREHFILQHHLLVLAGHSPELFSSELSAANRCYIRFGRPDMYTVYWEGPVSEGQSLYPVQLLLHPDFVSTAARPDLDHFAPFHAFKLEADRLRRPVRFLITEWLRLDPSERCPRFIRWFDSQVGFYDRFKGLYEYVVQMFALATNQDPPVSLATEEKRNRVHQARIEAEQAKLVKAQQIVENCTALLRKLQDPHASVDRDIMSIPTVSLPGKAGAIAPAKVVHNRGTIGKDLSEVVADHSDPVTTDHVARTKPWSSYKRSTYSDRKAAASEPYSVPRLLPSFRSVRFEESDERQRPSEGCIGPIRRRDRGARVTVMNYAPMTQDEVEEYDPLEEQRCVRWVDDQ